MPPKEYRRERSPALKERLLKAASRGRSRVRLDLSWGEVRDLHRAVTEAEEIPAMQRELADWRQRKARAELALKKHGLRAALREWKTLRPEKARRPKYDLEASTSENTDRESVTLAGASKTWPWISMVAPAGRVSIRTSWRVPLTMVAQPDRAVAPVAQATRRTTANIVLCLMDRFYTRLRNPKMASPSASSPEAAATSCRPLSPRLVRRRSRGGRSRSRQGHRVAGRHGM